MTSAGALRIIAEVTAMKRSARLAIMAVAPLLMAAMWMDRQPSIKPYEAPVLTASRGQRAGHRPGDRFAEYGVEESRNTDRGITDQGKALFAINCAMCHGQTSAERGPVGKKLNPPPPGLDHDLLQELSDAAIFKAITFGFGRMPPFRSKLSPRERWDLVTFLRTRK